MCDYNEKWNTWIIKNQNSTFLVVDKQENEHWWDNFYIAKNPMSVIDEFLITIAKLTHEATLGMK